MYDWCPEKLDNHVALGRCQSMHYSVCMYSMCLCFALTVAEHRCFHLLLLCVLCALNIWPCMVTCLYILVYVLFLNHSYPSLYSLTFSHYISPSSNILILLPLSVLSTSLTLLTHTFSLCHQVQVSTCFDNWEQKVSK